ncbi:hypothetical protein [Metasolibacillus fluoroglycofenilyticus]|uniref:hypothetical protein n=1 Tax=Metasolibacillus fluoroglycofenilyticus TaxID=1239396 RepID=UPI000D3CE33F|nr:hypothetical protein [Metasolibacillus fluoroglycofenilyticus]
MNEVIKFIEVPVQEKWVTTAGKELLDDLDKPLYTESLESPLKEYRSLEDSLNDVSNEEKEIYKNANLEERK